MLDLLSQWELLQREHGVGMIAVFDRRYKLCCSGINDCFDGCGFFVKGICHSIDDSSDIDDTGIGSLHGVKFSLLSQIYLLVRFSLVFNLSPGFKFLSAILNVLPGFQCCF